MTEELVAAMRDLSKDSIPENYVSSKMYLSVLMSKPGEWFSNKNFKDSMLKLNKDVTYLSQTLYRLAKDNPHVEKKAGPRRTIFYRYIL